MKLLVTLASVLACALASSSTYGVPPTSPGYGIPAAPIITNPVVPVPLPEPIPVVPPPVAPVVPVVPPPVAPVAIADPGPALISEVNIPASGPAVIEPQLRAFPFASRALPVAAPLTPLARALPAPVATPLAARAFPTPLAAPLTPLARAATPFATPLAAAPAPIATPLAAGPIATPLAAGPIATPLATPLAAPSTQFQAQDELGGFSFGYENANSAKQEVRTADGVTRGAYSYIDANGIPQRVEYIADPINGFRVAGTNIPVGPSPIAPITPVATPLAAIGTAPINPVTPVATPLAAFGAGPIPTPLAAFGAGPIPTPFAAGPLPIADTPEVAAAKAEFALAYEAALARNADLPAVAGVPVGAVLPGAVPAVPGVPAIADQGIPVATIEL